MDVSPMNCGMKSHFLSMISSPCILLDVLSTYTFIRNDERDIAKSTSEQQEDVLSVIQSPMTSMEFMTLKGRPSFTHTILTSMKRGFHVPKISINLQQIPWIIIYHLLFPLTHPQHHQIHWNHQYRQSRLKFMMRSQQFMT